MNAPTTEAVRHSKPYVRVEGVSKKFSRNLKHALGYGVQDILRDALWWRRTRGTALRASEFWAVENISFTLESGQGIGIIGDNGAGKSTLLKMLQGLLKPDRGQIEIQGKMCVLDLGSSVMPWLTGLENISAQAALMGIDAHAIQARTAAILDFAELGDFIHSPVGYYSTGMRARLGFAIVTQLEPDILVVDEVLSVGDFFFQNKCREFIKSFLDRGGILLLVSHSADQVQAVCQTGLVLEHGRALYQGSAVDAFDSYYKRKSQRTGVEPVQSLIPRAPTAQTAVTIDNIEVVPLETETLQTGKPAQIRVHYSAARRFEHVSWSITIFNLEVGLAVAGGGNLEASFLEAGAGILTCRIPRLPLMNGTFALRVGISNVETGIPLAQAGWYDAPYSFHVENPASPANNVGMLVQVLTVLDGEWGQSDANEHARVRGNGAVSSH